MTASTYTPGWHRLLSLSMRPRFISLTDVLSLFLSFCQLAKFEAFLQKSGAEDIQVTIRGRQRLAYPIKTFADGIYVLYTYDANPQVVAPVQKLLSTPTAGAELNVLRHMTFRI